MKLTPIQLNRVASLRHSMMMDAVLGNYKNFKNAKKEYASLAVQDFESIKKLPVLRLDAPLFSIFGMRMMYIGIRDFFRIKTPDEKLLKKLGEQAKAENMIRGIK